MQRYVWRTVCFRAGYILLGNLVVGACKQKNKFPFMLFFHQKYFSESLFQKGIQSLTFYKISRLIPYGTFLLISLFAVTEFIHSYFRFEAFKIRKLPSISNERKVSIIL